MLTVPIRLINNGDTLDEINLNRAVSDIRANIEEIFRQLGDLGDSNATPDLIPGATVKRDENGTAKFGEPTEPEHPIRKADAALLFKRGMIMMWSGSLAEVPAGWALCDGGNGTPNLLGRFVVGAGADYAVGDIGGEDEVTLTVNQMPSHKHTGSTAAAGNHRHNIGADDDGPDYTGPYTKGGSQYKGSARTSYAGNHSHGMNLNNTGGDAPHENRPPYYALAYIMKL